MSIRLIFFEYESPKLFFLASYFVSYWEVLEFSHLSTLLQPEDSLCCLLGLVAASLPLGVSAYNEVRKSQFKWYQIVKISRQNKAYFQKIVLTIICLPTEGLHLQLSMFLTSHSEAHRSRFGFSFLIVVCFFVCFALLFVFFGGMPGGWICLVWTCDRSPIVQWPRQMIQSHALFLYCIPTFILFFEWKTN